MCLSPAMLDLQKLKLLVVKISSATTTATFPLRPNCTLLEAKRLFSEEKYENTFANCNHIKLTLIVDTPLWDSFKEASHDRSRWPTFAFKRGTMRFKFGF